MTDVRADVGPTADTGRRYAVVLTTIGEGGILLAYAELLRRHPRPDNVSVHIIGDVNTPPECARQAQRLAAEGLRFDYVDCMRQEAFLRPFPELARALPYRSDCRRNVGFLLGLQSGADVLISIDDDSYPPLDGDFLRNHGAVGTRQTLPVTRTENGWFNVGALLTARDAQSRPFTLYCRGYPYARRGGDQSAVADSAHETAVVGANLGLWLGEPDLDAATRLVMPCQTSALLVPACFLGIGHRTPISSQNAAVAWHAVPAYYFVVQGQSIGGLRINRYGDIFSGYFLQMCAESVGHRVRIGEPCIQHHRNQHDLLADLAAELPGMALLNAMIPLLEDPLPPSPSYVDAYRLLADRLDAWEPRQQQGFLSTGETRVFCRNLTRQMRHWLNACVEIAGGERSLGVSRHPGR